MQCNGQHHKHIALAMQLYGGRPRSCTDFCAIRSNTIPQISIMQVAVSYIIVLNGEPGGGTCSSCCQRCPVLQKVKTYKPSIHGPSTRNPQQISAYLINLQKLESLPPIVWVFLHSNFCGELQKMHFFWNRVRIGRSWS